MKKYEAVRHTTKALKKCGHSHRTWKVAEKCAQKLNRRDWIPSESNWWKVQEIKGR